MEESLSHTTERENVKKQCSPTFLAPETSFVEDNFSMDQGYGDGFGMILIRNQEPRFLLCAGRYE